MENLIEKIEIDVGDTGHITNCYFICDKSKNLVIIDPADKADKIINKIEVNGYRLCAIILTHCHADHINAVAEIVKKYDVKVYVGNMDIGGINNSNINCERIVGIKVPYIGRDYLIGLKNEESISFGDMLFKIYETPGHTKGCICILEKTSNVLFTGDTLFSDTYGRTDLESGSHEDMKRSLDALYSYFSNILCYPGHGREFLLKENEKKIKLLFAYKG